MGGCRCTYRKCQSSTAASPGLHYFHFPVRDPQRCQKWIENARKPAFRVLAKDKLRNKVICSLHFEERCFTNERHDRLIHSAVPTLGFEDDDSIDNNVQNSDSNTGDDIMLIPVDDNNTKFTLPNVEFPGMSYTIFDDTVIPTSKIEEVIIRELEKNPTTKMKDIHVQSVVQKIKTTLPLLNSTKSKIKPIIKSVSTVKTENVDLGCLDNFNTNLENTTTNSFMFKDMGEDAEIVPSESNLINQEKSNNNITTYSVSTGNNGEVSVEPTHIVPDIIEDFSEDNSETPEKNSETLMEDIQIEYRNDNEYNVAITPVTLVKNFPAEENIQNREESSQESTISENNETEIQMESVTISNEPDVMQTIEIQTEEEIPEMDENDYKKIIDNNTKQIKQLKNFVHKQSRFNRYLWQRNQMPNFKRKMQRHYLIRTLKNCLKPSLLAILKLELLPQDDIFLTEKEEKFISDLYTENPECYNILRTKFGWKLPATEKSVESSAMEVDKS